MKKFALLAAVAALTACAQSESVDNAAADNTANDMAMNEATPAAMSLNGTTWEYYVDGAKRVTSIAPDGNYITQDGDGGHVDHGSYVQKEAGDCFTSAMNDEGEICWTTAENVEIGASDEATNDRGQSGSFTRVEYREMTM